MKYQYWLACQKNLSGEKVRALLDSLGSAEAIYFAEEKRLAAIQGITDKDIRKLNSARQSLDVDLAWCKFQEKGIGFTSWEQKDYPSRLRHIWDSPYGLFYKGKLPDEKRPAVAIVGARNRTAYGQTAAVELAKALASSGIHVISGLARGIDADAHKGALQGIQSADSGATFGVLGCGVDVVYPKGNRYLYEEILERGGGILSEFPIGTQPVNTNFPRRNRIISGLSDKIVVMEAREKSGSLITADFAMEQGRDIYALPGRISDPLSQGTNRLISQGSGIYLSPEEFLKDLGFAPIGGAVKDSSLKNTLEKEEVLLYSEINFEPIGLGSLMEKTGLSMAELLPLLEKLLGKKMIREQPANFFSRCKMT